MDCLDDEEWDISFYDELDRIEVEVLSTRQASSNPAPVPQDTVAPVPQDTVAPVPQLPVATAALPTAASYPSSSASPLSHIATAPHALDSRNPSHAPAPVPHESVFATAALSTAASYPSSSALALSQIATAPYASNYRKPSHVSAPVPQDDPFDAAAFPIAASYPYSPALPISQIPAVAPRLLPPRQLSQRPTFAVASGSDSPASGSGHSPPRKLSQRPATAKEVDAREAERRECERIKRELDRVSKQMKDLKRGYDELKKDTTKKDLAIKAKEAEIQNLKTANVGNARKDICSEGMYLDQSFHTPVDGALHAGGSCRTPTRRADNIKNKELCSSRDGLSLNQTHETDASEVLELRHQRIIDNRTGISGVSLQGSAHLESKSSKCKENKTIGVQTDLPLSDEHVGRKKVLLDRISSNLCAIWGRPAISLSERNLNSKILASCSEQILMLFQSTRLPVKCETSSEVSSSMNNAISEVYDTIIKMNSGAIPVQTLVEALLNLCAVGNAVIVGRTLQILHSILHNLLIYGTKSNPRNNVYIETYVNHEDSSTLLNTADAENLLRIQEGLYVGNVFFPHTFWTSFFTAMLQIGVNHSEESIRVDALSIMILIVRTSEPKRERERFGFASVMESLHQLLQKENGLLVKKHSVHILFLLLNCPALLKLLCTGGKDGSEPTEAVGCENDKRQQAISSVLKDLSESLTCGATTSLELKLSRSVINLLAYIASSGKLGYEVLLRSVTPRGATFLELIMEVLALQMECEVDFSTEMQELLKERYLLMREALILLNRLASHASFSKSTLEVLTRSNLCATFTIDIANRLPQRNRYPLRQLSEINPQMANDLAELAQKFRSRVYGFLEEQHSTTAVDRSAPNPSTSGKSLL